LSGQKTDNGEVRYNEKICKKSLPYDVFVARTSVKSGDKSLEYEDGGEKEGKETRKNGNDGDTNKHLEFAFPPEMAFGIIRAMIFHAD
jgi:hypothetical protein